MEAVKWLSASTALNLTVRLKVVVTKHCHIFSANERARIEVHQRLIRFLWPEKSQMWQPPNCLQIAMYIGGGPINVVCVDLGKHHLCTLSTFTSILMPRGQF